MLINNDTWGALSLRKLCQTRSPLESLNTLLLMRNAASRHQTCTEPDRRQERMSYIFNIELSQQINEIRNSPTHHSEDSSEVRCDPGLPHAPDYESTPPNLFMHLFTGCIVKTTSSGECEKVPLLWAVAKHKDTEMQN